MSNLLARLDKALAEYPEQNYQPYELLYKCYNEIVDLHTEITKLQAARAHNGKQGNTWILHKQAEAVEDAARTCCDPVGGDATFNALQNFAKKLRDNGEQESRA